jgi:hypothetical protein
VTLRFCGRAETDVASPSHNSTISPVVKIFAFIALDSCVSPAQNQSTFGALIRM